MLSMALTRCHLNLFMQLHMVSNVTALVTALDLPLVFYGGPQTRPWARVSSDRYWSSPHRGHICRLEYPFR